MVVTLHSKKQQQEATSAEKERKKKKGGGTEEAEKEKKKRKSMDDKDLKLRGTRGWSPIGFLIMICQCGLDAVTTASDCRKRFIIEFIEEHYLILCGRSIWSSLGLDMQVRQLRLINHSFSKT